MCSRPFVHIHNHTEYSLLDGANRIPDLVSRAKELGMPALAITDHGVMFGVMEFYWECIKQGIKPIIGMEAYVAPDGLHHKRNKDDLKNKHLLLLAKNETGYKNLCKLHTVAALEGFYNRPRIDHELLKNHAEGLIGTSACLGSEICGALMGGRYDEAEKIAGFYKEIFDEGSFYIELQDHRLPEQAEIREDLIKIARRLKLPLVATNDAHYLCKESSRAHDALLCVGIGALVNEPKKAPRFSTDEFYLKSVEEMEALFSDVPEALENTMLIAEQCNLELGKRRAPMPKPELPEGLESTQFLREISEKGLEERATTLNDAAWQRLNYELEVIEKTGFEDYFLLVREFANFTRSNGIAFGVRGSAAGSLVSYCIGITDVDPLEYDLTFERFLNIERISMPDIDMDFEDARRDEVIRYVTERFGQDQVAQIITFGTLGAKASIKDAGRVLGRQPAETDRICKLLPNRPGLSLANAIQDPKALDEGDQRDATESAEFRNLYRTDESVSEVVDLALEFEGLSRHAGVHAAGVVISGEPLMDYIPLYRGNDGQAITAFEMGILEKIGLLKMDFLGLSNLTVLARAVELIRASHAGKSPDEHPLLEKPIHEIALDEPRAYDLLSRGETVGVFQLESAGMRRHIVELKPQNVRELAAMIALYRPGPLDHIPSFINNKFGKTKPNYMDSRMQPILEETYGIIVYQDQVLKLVQALAGFSLGRADILRRAMGKKDKNALNSLKADFVNGCAANEIPEDRSEEIWALLEPFAGYAFNKAHAVCYALISYQTAYLKALYPTEYMVALLEVYRSREDKVTAFIEECRRMKIAILPPDINRSDVGFAIEEKVPKGYLGAIRFGLVAIKGVGEAVVRAILEERSITPFSHLYEFCERLKPMGLNRTALEGLIESGAFDSIEPNRMVLMNVVEGALVFAEQMNRDRLMGQDSLFGEQEGQSIPYPSLPAVSAASRSEILAMEKRTMGIYISDHPLRGLEVSLKKVVTHDCASYVDLTDGTRVTLAGVITSLRTRPTKDGGKRISMTLEDFGGVAPVTVSGNVLAKCENLLVRDKVVVVKGIVSQFQMRSGDTITEVRAMEVQDFVPPVSVDLDEDTNGTIIITLEAIKAENIDRLKSVFKMHPGNYRVVISQGELMIELIHRVDGSAEFLKEVKRCYSRGNIEKIDAWSIQDSVSASPTNGTNGYLKEPAPQPETSGLSDA